MTNLLKSYLLDKANIGSLKFTEAKPDRTDTTFEPTRQEGRIVRATPDNMSHRVTYPTVPGGEIKPHQHYFKWKV